MMTLPTFTKKNPSVASLRRNKRRLQAQADKMLGATGLVAVLRSYGEVTLGGSYVYAPFVPSTAFTESPLRT